MVRCERTNAYNPPLTPPRARRGNNPSLRPVLGKEPESSSVEEGPVVATVPVVPVVDVDPLGGGVGVVVPVVPVVPVEFDEPDESVVVSLSCGVVLSLASPLSEVPDEFDWSLFFSSDTATLSAASRATRAWYFIRKMPPINNTLKATAITTKLTTPPCSSRRSFIICTCTLLISL